MGDNRGDTTTAAYWGTAAAPQHHRRGVRHLLAARPICDALGTSRDAASAGRDTLGDVATARPHRDPACWRHDRGLGVRLVAGADEAGRGCLAGPAGGGRGLPRRGAPERPRARPGRPGRLQAARRRAARERAVRRGRARPRRRGGRVRRAGRRDRPARPAPLEPGTRWRGRCGAASRCPRCCLTDGFAAAAPAAPEHRAVIGGDGTQRGHRRGVDRGQGDARPATCTAGRRATRLRVRAARRLHHAGAHARRPRAAALTPLHRRSFRRDGVWRAGCSSSSQRYGRLADHRYGRCRAMAAGAGCAATGRRPQRARRPAARSTCSPAAASLLVVCEVKARRTVGCGDAAGRRWTRASSGGCGRRPRC